MQCIIEVIIVDMNYARQQLLNSSDSLLKNTSGVGFRTWRSNKLGGEILESLDVFGGI